MGVKGSVCEICGAKTPSKTIDELTDLGYQIMEINGPRSKNHKYIVVCPNHSEKESSDCFGAALSEQITRDLASVG